MVGKTLSLALLFLFAFSQPELYCLELNDPLSIPNLWFYPHYFFLCLHVLLSHPWCPRIHHPITHHFFCHLLIFFSCFIRMSALLGNFPKTLGPPNITPPPLAFIELHALPSCFHSSLRFCSHYTSNRGPRGRRWHLLIRMIQRGVGEGQGNHKG